MKKALMTAKQRKLASGAQLQWPHDGPRAANLQTLQKQQQGNLLFAKGEQSYVTQEGREENISAETVLVFPILDNYLVTFTKNLLSISPNSKRQPQSVRIWQSEGKKKKKENKTNKTKQNKSKHTNKQETPQAPVF